MKSSFVLLECVRILLPGFYFTVLLFIYVKIFIIGSQPTTFSTLTLSVLFAFITIIAGLTMYAQETPKRRKAFQSNQPSTFIKNISSQLLPNEPLSDEEARRVYFYILNVYIPERFHEKIFFFGTMYSVIIQIRRTSLWFGIVSLLSVVLPWFSYGISLPSVSSLLYLLFVWFLYFFYVRYNKAERSMQYNYSDQIFWLEMNKDIINTVLLQFSKLKGYQH